MALYDTNKTTYLNPNIEYLFDEVIIEYDIKDAGYNIIKQYNLLPPEKIKELDLLGKGIERHIAVGKLQKADREFSHQLLNKFAELRMIFINTNNLTDDKILSVKKDAIYTLRPCKRIKFGGIIFDCKNMYSSYIRFPNISNLEIYYSPEKIDIKGMSDSSVNRHRLYMLEFIRKIIMMIEDQNPRVKRYLIDFINRYKSNNLDEEYYYEFNNTSNKFNPVFNYQNILIPLVQIIQKVIL